MHPRAMRSVRRRFRANQAQSRRLRYGQPGRPRRHQSRGQHFFD